MGGDGFGDLLGGGGRWAVCDGRSARNDSVELEKSDQVSKYSQLYTYILLIYLHQWTVAATYVCNLDSQSGLLTARGRSGLRGTSDSCNR